MTIAQVIADRVEKLPPEQQQKALEFVESLMNERTAQPHRRDPLGALKGQIADLPLEEFQAVRG